MALFTYELSLAGFRFPNRLPGKHSNFRFVADVRYVSSRGEHDTQHAVMPDLERHWECDPDRTEESQYVRGADIGSFGTFDMSRIDAWDRLIMLAGADAIHSVQVKVFDIDRPNFLDRLGGYPGRRNRHDSRAWPKRVAWHNRRIRRCARNGVCRCRVCLARPIGRRRPLAVSWVGLARRSRRLLDYGYGRCR